MDNKNTFPLHSNIISEKGIIFTPRTGDELIFSENEESALAAYKTYIKYQRECRDSYEENIQEFITDIFKLNEVNGVICEPVYIGGKKFGMFGCRLKLCGVVPVGHFFLYETE